MQNIIKIIFLLLSAFYFISSSFSQGLSPSNVKAKVEHKDSTITYYSSGLCFIQIDEAGQEIRLRLDFSTFHTENDSVDAWLHKVHKKHLKYKGSFQIESVTKLSNNGTKEINSVGELYINNTHHPCKIQFILMDAQNGMLSNTSSTTTVNSIKIAFSFQINPDDYRINFKHHDIVKPIQITVGNGNINTYVIGSENIFNEHH